MSLNDRSESLSRTLPKLEIKEFEIHFFHITTIAIIVVEMYGFYSIYFQYKIRILKKITAIFLWVLERYVC